MRPRQRSPADFSQWQLFALITLVHVSSRYHRLRRRISDDFCFHSSSLAHLETQTRRRCFTRHVLHYGERRYLLVNLRLDVRSHAHHYREPDFAPTISLHLGDETDLQINLQRQRSMPKLKAILWDNDGVLVDTEALFYQANRELFAEHDIALTHQHFFDWFLMENLGAWHLLQARGMDDLQITTLRDQRNQRYASLLAERQSHVIVGIADILHYAAQHTRMGVVTSSRRDHFQQIHHTSNLLHHFEFIITEGDYRHSKPAADPYLAGLARLGLPADECIVVEDSPRGLRSAQAAGLPCVVIRNAFCKHYDFPGAYRVLDNHDELAEFISEWL